MRGSSPRTLPTVHHTFHKQAKIIVPDIKNTYAAHTYVSLTSTSLHLHTHTHVRTYAPLLLLLLLSWLRSFWAPGDNSFHCSPCLSSNTYLFSGGSVVTHWISEGEWVEILCVVFQMRSAPSLLPQPTANQPHLCRWCLSTTTAREHPPGSTKTCTKGVKRRGPNHHQSCLLYTSPSPRDSGISRMPSSA